jgi:hypothetical protein
VLLYRTAPEDLRLVFYDEVCERMWGGVVSNEGSMETGLGRLGIGSRTELGNGQAWWKEHRIGV